jgi:O-acetyl-ADP-ribose deacetylase (regulator of RNase III)
MKIVEGNLLDMAMNGDFDVIIHGCNCFCNMGAGIALQIARRFPEAYEIDKQTEYADKNKLGTYSFAKIVRNGIMFHIVNAYTQYGCGIDRVRCDYDALDTILNKIAFAYNGLRIGYPKIGAGLAGGDWNVIYEIIEKQLEGQHHTLVILP